MLSQLYIENIAVIQKATINFTTGFNVFTGETGAGKTILISAINAVLGARTYRDIIRSGETQATVSALFTQIPPEVAGQITNLGYPVQDGQLVISRDLDSDSSKGGCRIDGRPATTALLRLVAGLLINIHGQRDNQELLSLEKHLQFIDSFGGLEEDLVRYQAAYQKMVCIRERLEAVQMDESYKLQRMDILQYQTQEISVAALEEGEEEELTAKRNIIRNAEKIVGSLGAMYRVLQGDEQQEGLISAMGMLKKELDTATSYIEALGEYIDQVGESTYNLEELSITVRSALDEYSFHPKQLEEVENRLDTIYRLKKKYGSSISDILTYYEKINLELEDLTLSDELVEKLKEEMAEAQAQAESLAHVLSSRRQKAAKRFVDQVMEELVDLDMPNVSLSVVQTPKELGPTGGDTIELLFSANPGETPRPLSRIASGGELSRTMLAIKNILAGKDDIGTIIFDEVDTGVSGRAAQKIGVKLHQVATSRQVICVTHLAQVAANGDHHIKICKTVEEGRTYTQVQPLTRIERMEELARMIGGENITDLSLRNADEMLTLAGQ